MAGNDDGCYQWCKDTNFLANHNRFIKVYNIATVVTNGAKILIF